MPKLIVTHEVDDIEHWLASPKREEVFGGVATNIRTFVHDTSRVAYPWILPTWKHSMR
jgi:hypothetical protein